MWGWVSADIVDGEVVGVQVSKPGDTGGPPVLIGHGRRPVRGYYLLGEDGGAATGELDGRDDGVDCVHIASLVELDGFICLGADGVALLVTQGNARRL